MTEKMPEPVAWRYASDWPRCVYYTAGTPADDAEFLYTADQMREFANEATRLAMDRAIEAVEFEKVEAEETKHPIDYAYNKALDHAKDGIRSALSGLNSTTSGN